MTDEGGRDPGSPEADGPVTGGPDPGEQIEIATGRVTGQTTHPVESATVMLLRDTPDGLQVFMLERHVDSDFAGGAYAFPGGKVDDRDRHLDPVLWDGLDLPAQARLMRADRGLTLGWHVAAVRETFEEAGFLLARRGGQPVAAVDLESASFRRARRRLAARDDDWDWRDWLAAENLRLDLGALAWWSWWATPHGLHKRYDTRFFVARVPDDQTGVHDDVEVVSSRWLAPDGALATAASGRATVIYPTRKNLETLSAFTTAREAIRAARAGDVDRRRTLPEIVRVGDGDAVRIRHPFTGQLEEP